MLQGLLVDLVPFGTRFQELMHTWENGPAAFWGDVGDRQFFTHAALKRRQEEFLNAPSPRMFIVWGIQAKDGTPLGLFALNGLQQAFRWAELGAIIGDPAYWGGGYGTDALLLAVEYGFDWLDLRRIWLHTMSLNVRVQRQMDKVGFTLEARRREKFVADGQRVDELTYGLMREEWPGRLAVIERLGLTAR